MRLEERRIIVGLLIAGAVGTVVCFPGIYFLGLWLAPPRPVPEATPAPPIIRDALWARADGGRATGLRPINPINFMQHRFCRALAVRQDDPRVRAERRAGCLKSLPAVQGVDYLSDLHMRDNDVEPRTLRMGIGQFATAVWLTRSWTRGSFLDTLAARGEYGIGGWRGVEAAAQGYFQKTADRLALHEVAMIAAVAGDRRADPWCDAGYAVTARNRILSRMRDNGAIAEVDYEHASSAPLELAPPPVDRPPCQK